jgi:hypothetical protein
MGRNKELANRLTEVLLNGRWIANTNYKAQIENLTWKQATQKTGSLNTIASLTYHIDYYLAGMIHVFRGGELEIRDKYSFDIPPIESENDWKQLVEEFIRHSEVFIKEVLNLSDSKLDAVFAEEKYGTYLRNIEGLIEHSYYHLGQIVLIKKIITEKVN